jgi:hypothetical protein
VYVALKCTAGEAGHGCLTLDIDGSIAFVCSLFMKASHNLLQTVAWFAEETQQGMAVKPMTSFAPLLFLISLLQA